MVTTGAVVVMAIAAVVTAIAAVVTAIVAVLGLRSLSVTLECHNSKLRRETNVRMRDAFKENMSYYLSNLAERRYKLGTGPYSSMDDESKMSCVLLLGFFDNICLLYKNEEIDLKMVDEKFRPIMLQLRKVIDDSAMDVLKDQLQEDEPFKDFVAKVHVWKEEISKTTNERLSKHTSDGVPIEALDGR